MWIHRFHQRSKQICIMLNGFHRLLAKRIRKIRFHFSLSQKLKKFDEQKQRKKWMNKKPAEIRLSSTGNRSGLFSMCFWWNAKRQTTDVILNSTSSGTTHCQTARSLYFFFFAFLLFLFYIWSAPSRVASNDNRSLALLWFACASFVIISCLSIDALCCDVHVLHFSFHRHRDITKSEWEFIVKRRKFHFILFFFGSHLFCIVRALSTVQWPDIKFYYCNFRLFHFRRIFLCRLSTNPIVQLKSHSKCVGCCNMRQLTIKHVISNEINDRAFDCENDKTIKLNETKHSIKMNFYAASLVIASVDEYHTDKRKCEETRMQIKCKMWIEMWRWQACECKL